MSDDGEPQQTSDEALLALIVSDEKALLVLAAWGAVAPKLAHRHDEQLHTLIASIAGVTVSTAGVCLQRLAYARVLVDGGISNLADRLLQSHVKSNLEKSKR